MLILSLGNNFSLNYKIIGKYLKNFIKICSAFSSNYLEELINLLLQVSLDNVNKAAFRKTRQ